MLPYDSYKPTDGETQFVGNLLNIQPNDISYIFFSDANIDTINNTLIEEIKRMTFESFNKTLIIEPQDKKLLVTVMRFIYFQSIQNKYTADIEVLLLNKEVLKKIIPTAMSELISYLRYINDINRYAAPYDDPNFHILPLPVNTNSRKKGPLRQPTDLFGF